MPTFFYRTVGLFLLVLAAVLSSRSASGRDWFVNNVAGDDTLSGSDPFPRTIESGPFRSLARALRAAGPGDRIVLADTGEPYRECVALQGLKHSRIGDQPFIIDGQGAVMDGSALVPPEAWRHYGGDFYQFRPRRLHHQQLFLDGQPLKRRELGAGRSLPNLKPLEWCLYDQSIIFRAEEHRPPALYDLSYAKEQVALTLYQVRGVEIRDLTITGYQLDGVNAHDSVFETQLLGLTCMANGRSGVSVGGASRVTISGCQMSDNGEAELRTEGRSITRIIDCDLKGEDVPKILQDGGRVIRE